MVGSTVDWPSEHCCFNLGDVRSDFQEQPWSPEDLVCAPDGQLRIWKAFLDSARFNSGVELRTQAGNLVGMHYYGARCLVFQVSWHGAPLLE